MPSVSDLKTSKYLTKHDVDPPILVTIKSYKKMNVAADGNDPDLKYVFYFNEVEKPLVLNVTNGNIIASIAGSDDFDHWLGVKIVLLNDPTISFGGKMTGGIRVRAPKKSAAVQTPVQEQPQIAPPPTDEDYVADDDLPF